MARTSAVAQKYFDKRVEYGRAEMEIIGLDREQLPITIKHSRNMVQQIKALQAVVKKMDSDLNVKETRLDLGGISIRQRGVEIVPS